MANSPGTEWLTVSQVAETLGTSTETVRRMIKAGKLPASRASTLPRAPWLINGPAWEQQKRVDAERARVRERMAGVVVGRVGESSATPAVVGRGDEFVEKLEQTYPGVTVGSPEGPTLAEHARATIARHELFDRIEREMAADPGVRQQLERLNDEDRVEAEARELAKRIQRAERIRDRALEILDEEDDQH